VGAGLPPHAVAKHTQERSAAHQGEPMQQAFLYSNHCLLQKQFDVLPLWVWIVLLATLLQCSCSLCRVIWCISAMRNSNLHDRSLVKLPAHGLVPSQALTQQQDLRMLCYGFG
jgi:hypothetical protein